MQSRMGNTATGYNWVVLPTGPVELHMKLRIDYMIMLAPEESAPQLHVWLTQSSANAEFDRIKLPDMRRLYSEFRDITAYAGTVSVPLRRTIQPDQAKEFDEHLLSANLNLDLMTVAANHHQEMCLLPGGGCIIPLKALMGPKPVLAYATFPMVEDTDKRIKATFMVQVDPDSTYFWKYRLRYGSVPSPYTDRTLTYNFRPFIEDKIRRFGAKGMRSRFPELDYVNMFAFQSRLGGELPAETWLDAPVLPTSEDFFQNALDIALARRGLRRDEAARLVPDRSARAARELSLIVAEMISIYVQYLSYVSDEVYIAVRDSADPPAETTKWTSKRLPIDWFQYVRVRECGDCEDMAMELVMEALELQQLKTNDPLMKLLQYVAGHYHPVLLLDGVRSAEIATSVNAKESDCDAHMNAALVNRSYVAAHMAMHKAVVSGFAHIQKAVETAETRTLPGKKDHYPALIMLEGTGPLNPDDTAAQSKRAERFRAKMFSGPLSEKVRQTFTAADNTFYKEVKLMAGPTLQEMAGKGKDNFVAGQMICVVEDARRPFVAGVKFDDLAGASVNIRFRPENPLPPEGLAALRELKRDLHPVVPLYGPDVKHTAPQHILRARQQMDAVAARAYKLIPLGLHGKSMEWTTVLIKYHYFDDRGSFAEELAAAVEKFSASHTLGAFQYVEERSTTTVGGFRVKIGWP